MKTSVNTLFWWIASTRHKCDLDHSNVDQATLKLVLKNGKLILFFNTFTTRVSLYKVVQFSQFSPESSITDLGIYSFKV